MQNVTFYHAGCPVCIEAEENILHLIDTSKFNLYIVHLGEQPEQVKKAENEGVKSVPALVYGDTPFHINFGASIEELKK